MIDEDDEDSVELMMEKKKTSGTLLDVLQSTHDWLNFPRLHSDDLVENVDERSISCALCPHEEMWRARCVSSRK